MLVCREESPAQPATDESVLVVDEQGLAALQRTLVARAEDPRVRLAAGHVDEFQLHVVPVLLGGGVDRGRH